ncbi:MAG: hypothetical protein Q8S73_05745 [Deltaproteobacteria bacterium]|nr:hypothetical protein [Myxococcales bacterium]MDP3213585.1 hypothetical protein [Deltaproteobacteria bacterium]
MSSDERSAVGGDQGPSPPVGVGQDLRGVGGCSPSRTGSQGALDFAALSLADGSVARTVGFDDEWRADKAAPVVIGPATLMLPVKSYKHGGATRTVVVDTERGRVVAELGHEGELSGEAFPQTAHAETRRVAATLEGATVLWQLP